MESRFENDAADLFVALESQIAAERRRSSRRTFLAAVGCVVGIIAVIAGLSTHVLVSFAGYVLLLVCTLHLVGAAREHIARKATALLQRLLDR